MIKNNSAYKLFNPLYTHTDTYGASEANLPRLSENPLTNKALWNTLAVGSTAIVAGALIKALAAETQLSRYNRKHKAALEGKLNSIMPIAEPDTDLTDTAEKDRKRKKELEKTASDDNVSFANGFGARVVAGTLPILALAGGGYIGTKIVDEYYKDRLKQDTQDEIKEYENELDAIQARLLKARMKAGKKKTKEEDIDTYDIFKTASIADKADSVATGFGLFSNHKPPMGGRLLDILIQHPFLVASLMAAGTGVGAYALFDKKNKKSKEEKELERLAATNMTNIPPRLVLSLDEEGNPTVENSIKN